MRWSQRRTASNSSSLHNPFRQVGRPESTTESSITTTMSSISRSIIPILPFLIPFVILYSIFLDTNVGGKLYHLRSITQTQLDTELKDIFPKIKSGVKIPPPSALLSQNATVALKPTMGLHRYDQDAIFSIADGLSIRQLAIFVITLRNTGFEGDIVFSTWPREYLSEEVINFFEYHSKSGVVVYEGVVIADNENQTMHLDEVNQTNVWLKGLYGREAENELYHDPRPARSLGIAKFELFWVWSLQYNTQSRILLIDAKDTFFQPFGETGIGVGRTCEESAPSVLHLYEENNHAVKLGTIENRAHLVEAYKEKKIMRFLHNFNVLSPASTHGPKKAIEAYLRAMTQQFDETGCATYQCEWAFHNYIYSFGILASMDEIDTIKSHMQGSGAVNSIGYNVPLNSTNNTEIFDNETVAVLNRRMGHGKHNSWAVHQYSRDPQLVNAVEELSDYLFMDVLSSDAKNSSQQMIQSSIFFFHEYDDKVDDFMRSKPTMGTHRSKEDAIFTFADGNFEDLVLFILSARKSGFQGDIVLCVPERDSLSREVIDFLEFHSKHGVVVYEGYDVVFEQGFYEFKLDTTAAAYETAKFEYFYIWSHHYKNNHIMILDGEFSYFQSNPFATQADCGQLILNFYEENQVSMNFRFLRIDNKDIWSAMQHIFAPPNEQVFLNKYKGEYVLNPGVLDGHQHVIQRYLLSLIDILQTSGCMHYGCDYAALNYMWYEEILEIGSPISVTLRSHHQGSHVINTGIAASLHFLSMKNLFDAEKNLYLNWSGEPSPVIMNYHMNTQLRDIFEERLEELLKEYPYK